MLGWACDNHTCFNDALKEVVNINKHVYVYILTANRACEGVCVRIHVYMQLKIVIV